MNFKLTFFNFPPCFISAFFLFWLWKKETNLLPSHKTKSLVTFNNCQYKYIHFQSFFFSYYSFLCFFHPLQFCTYAALLALFVSVSFDTKVFSTFCFLLLSYNFVFYIPKTSETFFSNIMETLNHMWDAYIFVWGLLFDVVIESGTEVS